ncbi:MAG: hypothetical protein IKQ43_05655 [Treponema sp.]|nr:hypothetical protein [Treponema sp.]MBR7079045.1 hypothetical protein [Treponema sp.]
MNKTVDFFRRAVCGGGLIILLLTGCASVPEPDKPEIPQEEIPEVKKEPVWEPVRNISQIKGLWVSEDGAYYEWPFELNGKKYLHYAWPEADDTEHWVDYAKLHNRDFMDVWNHRFSYIKGIYNNDYPLSDANGTQVGLKFRIDYSRPYSKDIPFRIYRRKEFLMPESLAKANLSFFLVSGGNMLKETGVMTFNSTLFNSLTADGAIYRLSRDYWKE